MNMLIKELVAIPLSKSVTILHHLWVGLARAVVTALSHKYKLIKDLNVYSPFEVQVFEYFLMDFFNFLSCSLQPPA